jgi:hypothetical protein
MAWDQAGKKGHLLKPVVCMLAERLADSTGLQNFPAHLVTPEWEIQEVALILEVRPAVFGGLHGQSLLFFASTFVGCSGREQGGSCPPGPGSEPDTIKQHKVGSRVQRILLSFKPLCCLGQ